ncbi:MAG: dihydropteroate synthase [Alphaproteobacteria bacterium]|nr:dihydropteroate synthase [Alphaproteobacteria bacterium]
MFLSNLSIMGIINITPDSFSGEGLLKNGKVDMPLVLERASQMVKDGATILDIGGESTRPGAKNVPQDEEIARTIPAIEAIRNALPDIPLSIDTRKPAVAALALQAGVRIVNNVAGAETEKAMYDLLKAHPKAYLVLMHNGVAKDKDDGVEDIFDALDELARAALEAGLERSQMILDPGLGFGKTGSQDLALLHHLDRVVGMGLPVLVGPSRKSFIGTVLEGDAQNRLEGTAACVALAAFKGAHILRVHDVAFMAKVARMAAAIADS